MARRKAAAATVGTVEPEPVKVAGNGGGFRLAALVVYKLALMTVAVFRIVFHYYGKMFVDIIHEVYLIATDGPPQRATDQTTEKGN